MTFKKLLSLFDYLFMPKRLYIGVPGAILGGSVISGLMGKWGSDTQADAIAGGTAEGRRQFDLEWDANALRREETDNALLRMAKMRDPNYEFEPTSPSYKFRFGEGMDAVKNYLSGVNKRMGGSAMKGIMDYGQGTASDEFWRNFNADATIAGMNPNAVQTPPNQIPNMIAAGGAAGAGKYSAYNDAIQGGIQNYLSYDAQNSFGGGRAPGQAISPYGTY